MARRWAIANRAVGVVWAAYASICLAPEALAVPFRVDVDGVRVRSETPIDRVGMAAILADSDRRFATSGLGVPPPRRIFLTNNGWRWHLLGQPATRAFALTRPFSDAIILNRADIAHNRVVNDALIGGVRTLSGTMAHEMTHLAVNRRYGSIRAFQFPDWKSEGYADYVAQESSITDAQAAQLRAQGATRGAIAYYSARRRVAVILARGGGPDALFLGS